MSSRARRKVDLTDWVPEKEAAARLDISVRTLRRKPDHQPPARAKRPRPRKRPEPVYSPEDIAMLEAQRIASVVYSAAASDTDSVRIDHIAQMRNIVTEALQSVFEQLASVLSPRPAVLTRRQAAIESGLTQAYIHRAIADGRLPVFRDGRTIKLRRIDLATLARQVPTGTAPQLKKEKTPNCQEEQQRNNPSRSRLPATSRSPGRADYSECPAVLMATGSVFH